MKTFQKGDRVYWTSQAGGVHVKKKGVIVEVVPSGTSMKVRDRDRATSRDHESYVVEVAGPTKKSKPRRYWPVAAALKLSCAVIATTSTAEPTIESMAEPMAEPTIESTGVPPIEVPIQTEPAPSPSPVA